MTKKGLKVSTRRTSVSGPVVLTRAAFARGSRGSENLIPRRKKRKSQRTEEVEPAADEDVADEARTPGGPHIRETCVVVSRVEPGQGPSQSRDAELDHLDLPDVKNVQAVVPYLTEIHRFYRETEGLKRASYGYMNRQSDINSKMREILFDWLVDKHISAWIGCSAEEIY